MTSEGSLHFVGALYRNGRGELISHPKRPPDLRLPDGTLFSDLRAAVQAAWLAGAEQLATDLLDRHNLYDVCIACASTFNRHTRLCFTCHLERSHRGLYRRGHT